MGHVLVIIGLVFSNSGFAVNVEANLRSKVNTEVLRRIILEHHGHIDVVHVVTLIDFKYTTVHVTVSSVADEKRQKSAPNKKLSDEDMGEIANLLSKGVKSPVIAKQFKVSLRTVQRIKSERA